MMIHSLWSHLMKTPSFRGRCDHRAWRCVTVSRTFGGVTLAILGMQPSSLVATDIISQSCDARKGKLGGTQR